MSEVAAKQPLRQLRRQNDSFKSQASQLLSEYREKLTAICTEVKNLRKEMEEHKANQNTYSQEINGQIQLLHKLRSPARALAQHISQKIEHGKLDELAKLELRLRLAEFEHAIITAERTH